MSALRTHHLHVSFQVHAGAQDAAMLAGLACGDDWAEMTLKAALEAIPALGEVAKKYAKAKADIRKEWMAEHSPKHPDIA